MAIGTAAALIGSAAIGAGGSALAAKSQKKSAQAGINAEQQMRNEELAFRENQWAESKPLRDIQMGIEGALAPHRGNLELMSLLQGTSNAMQLTPLLREFAKSQVGARQNLLGQQQSLLPMIMSDLNAQPGTSPLFQRTLEQQTRNIQSNLSPFGLSDSSVAGRAIGEGTAALTAQDLENMRNRRSSFFGLGMQGVNPPQQMSSGFGVQQAPQQSSVPFGNISQYAAGSQGQFGQNLGGMMGNFGGQLAQRGFSNLFGGGTGQTVGQGFNAFSAPPTQALTSPTISGFLNR